MLLFMEAAVYGSGQSALYSSDTSYTPSAAIRASARCLWMLLFMAADAR
jgi:hypothetical protein